MNEIWLSFLLILIAKVINDSTPKIDMRVWFKYLKEGARYLYGLFMLCFYFILWKLKLLSPEQEKELAIILAVLLIGTILIKLNKENKLQIDTSEVR